MIARSIVMLKQKLRTSLPVKRGACVFGVMLCTVLLLTACGGDGTQGGGDKAEYTLKLADSFPADHVISEEGPQYFTSRATELTNGRVEFDYFPAEQMGAADEMLNLTQSGVTDIGMIIPSYVPDTLPLSGVGNLPAMHENACEGTLAVDKLTQEGGILYEEEFAPENIRPLFVGTLPSYEVMTTDAPLNSNSLSDVEGLRLRSSGGTLDRTIEAIGAVPTPITTSEMYQAMQRGTVDGNVGAFMSQPPYGTDELIEYSTVGAGLGSTTLIYGISESTWDTLPSGIQDALMEASRETNQNLCASLNEENEAAHSEMEQMGVEFYTIPPEEQERWREAVQPVRDQWIEDMESRGLPGEATVRAMSEAVESVRED